MLGTVGVMTIIRLAEAIGLVAIACIAYVILKDID